MDVSRPYRKKKSDISLRIHFWDTFISEKFMIDQKKDPVAFVEEG